NRVRAASGNGTIDRSIGVCRKDRLAQRDCTIDGEVVTQTGNRNHCRQATIFQRFDLQKLLFRTTSNLAGVPARTKGNPHRQTSRKGGKRRDRHVSKVLGSLTRSCASQQEGSQNLYERLRNTDLSGTHREEMMSNFTAIRGEYEENRGRAC